VGLKVKLDRDIDREKPCHDNLAVIHPGKAQHAGEFRCAICGAHRGWCSQATHNLICETVRRFGAPGEPIIVRQNQQEKQWTTTTRTAALFLRTTKRNRKSPRITSAL